MSCFCGICISNDIQFGVAESSARAVDLRAAGRWPVGSDAHRGLPPVRMVAAETKLPPMKCQKCEYVNDYVGPEHLVAGLYYCRNHFAKAKAAVDEAIAAKANVARFTGFF